ncbi:MAG TPA: Rrf2 family transcriptional regulator [Bryobacteraceae bacterium]|nr:Rrf2 family transcriptional regulator [Bryobacteraceae bacterium]
MQLSRPVDYALRAMAYLASLPASCGATRSTLSRATGVPEPFLAKVMRRLVVARLVVAHRGVGGGFKLAEPPAQISLLRVVQAVDGPESIRSCFLSAKPCSARHPCRVHDALANVRVELAQALANTFVSDLPRHSGGGSLPAI